MCSERPQPPRGPPPARERVMCKSLKGAVQPHRGKESPQAAK